MAKKKAEDMRDELRQIISFTRGLPSAWQGGLINMEAQIRKDRQKAIYNLKKDNVSLLRQVQLLLCCWYYLEQLFGSSGLL